MGYYEGLAVAVVTMILWGMFTSSFIVPVLDRLTVAWALVGFLSWTGLTIMAVRLLVP